MLKNPPLSLSRSLQKTEGESKSGLGCCQLLWKGDRKVGRFGNQTYGSLPAHEINTAINTDKGTSPHIPNQAIIFNWQVTALPAAAFGDSCGRLHFYGSLRRTMYTKIIRLGKRGMI